MKRIALSIVWSLFWLILESTLLKNIDIIFLTVLAVGFSMGIADGLAIVLIMGFMADAVSSTPWGVMLSLYLATFMAIRIATSTIYIHSRLSQIIWTFIVSIAFLWARAGLLSLIYKNSAYIYINLLRFMPQALLNSILAIIVTPLFLWFISLTWEKLFKPKDLVWN